MKMKTEITRSIFIHADLLNEEKILNKMTTQQKKNVC